jgi:hypothetical protein
MSVAPDTHCNGCRRRICVTPVRNEAWIIDQFVSAARLWATDIIVADQRSTDGTLEKLKATPGVDVVINDLPTFDESHRQRLLLDRARQTPGNRILIGLDADEALSANFSISKEWQQLEHATPGTILRFRWVNILPGFSHAWIPPGYRAFGFIDDGSEHRGRTIHSPRVPQPPGAPTLDLEDVVVLHFQYIAWERMLSKQRWYRAWEHITHRQKGPLQIFREYNHMNGGWHRSEIHEVNPEWLEGYARLGIDFRRIPTETVTWWDFEVLRLMQEHGPDRFRKIDIWDKDWTAVAALAASGHDNLSDPRSIFDKSAIRLLRATQQRRSNLAVRVLESVLRRAGW